MAKEITAEEYFKRWSADNAERDKQLTEASDPEKVISKQRVDMLKKNIDTAFGRFVETYTLLQSKQSKKLVANFAIAQLSLVQRDKKNFENSEFVFGTDECDSVLRGIKGVTIALNEGKAPEEFIELMNVTHYNHRSFEWLRDKMRDIYIAEYNHRYGKKAEAEAIQAKDAKDEKAIEQPIIDTNAIFARFANIYQSIQNEKAQKVLSNLTLSQIALVQKSMETKSAQDIEEYESVLKTLESAISALNEDKTPEEFKELINKDAKYKNLNKFFTRIYSLESDHRYAQRVDDGLTV